MLVAGILAVWFFVFASIKKELEKRSQEVLQRFRDKKVLGVSAEANFFGQESRGMKQIRGNGILILTDEELYFQMLFPKKELTILVNSIIGVESTRSFLGKTKVHPLLKVDFKNDKDEADSAAWLLKDVDKWKQGLEQLINKQQEETK